MSLPQLIGLSLAEIIGDFAFKEFANKGGALALATGIVGYIGVCILLIVSLQGSTVLLVNNAWDGISSLIESIAAYIILGERFDNYLQYLGIIFIICGLFLLKIPLKKDHPFYIPKL
jgi:multidrug transporter EmrE-like cation transporter